MRQAFISLLLIICSFPASALAGWRVVQQDTLQGKSSDSVLYIEGKKMRAEVAFQAQALLIDVAADRLIIVDNGRKEYGETRLSEFIGQIKSALETIKALKAYLPPEVAKTVPDVSLDFKVDLQPTGKSEVISGFMAKEFAAKNSSGRDIGTVWLSKDGNIGKLHADLMTFSKYLGEELAMLAPIMAMAKEHGFPVKMHLLQPDNTYNDSLVKTIEAKALKSTIFVVPATYKKKDITEFISMPEIATLPQPAGAPPTKP